MKPKQLQITLAWLFIATLLMGAAVWQAQMAAARDLAARRQSRPPPAKTRHAVRNPPVTVIGDPAENYIARCRKGMTRQEIGWILEDYRVAGLDFDIAAPGITASELFALRSRQQRWYRDLLVEALQLDGAQKAQVTSRLAELLAAAKNRYNEQQLIWQAGKDPFDLPLPISNWWQQDGDPFGELDPAILPQVLCDLTPAQQALLARKNEAFDPELGIEFLPFLRSQAEALPPADEGLPQTMILHPAQLRLYLLETAGLAGELQNQLDQDSLKPGAAR